ncbi:MAG: hypothetical protein KDE59_09160, partial [Anaerolineales bacterium]|nr:hypothetical protein [Anaerolineales bacterium]
MLLLSLTLITLTLSEEAAAQSELPPNHPDISSLGMSAYNGPAIITATLNDLFVPGTQPGDLEDTIAPPNTCRACHAGYNSPPDDANETWHAWGGSMMSQAARDPLFWAALDIANADVENGGAFCIRCHAPQAWLEGRGAADGSQIAGDDFEGVQCEVCHRLVDPVYATENPDRDLIVLAGISPTVSVTGTAGMIVDPLDERRGPFDLQTDWSFNPHGALGLDWPLVSPYHQEAMLCGTCHDISNPLLSWNPTTEQYELNDPDTPSPDLSQGFPVERTYSEWLLSSYNTPQGVYAPQFGGNKDYVSICQDCHMHDITGAAGAIGGNSVIRNDQPLHDLTGASTWVPLMLPLHPVFSQTFAVDQARLDALNDGIDRARYMLQNAASMTALMQDGQLFVTVINESGHKLPTGYAEGRRMWLQVEGYNAAGQLIYQSGAYDPATGILTGYGIDPTLQVYEIKQGLTDDWATQLGLTAGESFHFILNNMIVLDNRIPPRGYDYDAFLAAGAAPYTAGVPDPGRYADGQYWDTTVYNLPPGVAYGRVRLLF